MNIQFNTERTNKPIAFFADKISNALSRYETRINRVTVHLFEGEENKKPQNGKTCTLEARPPGLEPVSVTYRAPTKELAINGAIVQFKSALEKTLNRLNHHQKQTTSK